MRTCWRSSAVRCEASMLRWDCDTNAVGSRRRIGDHSVVYDEVGYEHRVLYLGSIK
jgi:hypothetical protein